MEFENAIEGYKTARPEDKAYYLKIV